MAISRTTGDLITLALRNIGVLAAGEPASDEDMDDALAIAQEMIEAWSIEKLMVPAVTHESFDISTVGAAGQYTIGSSGTLNTVWPFDVVDVRIISGDRHYTLEKVGLKKWAGNPVKDSIRIPTEFYYEPSYPLGKIYLDSITETTQSMKVVSHKAITDLPALTASTAYPPGFNTCIRVNLEVWLPPAFEKPVNPDTRKLAKELKRGIKRVNSTPLNMKVDPALKQNRRYYNVSEGPDV